MKYLYETHMHTSEVSACGISTAAEQIISYKRKGYTGVIITDHFVNGNTNCPQHLPWKKKMKHFATGYDNAKKEGEKCGLDVFFGWEFSIRGSDFLTYGLGLDFLLANPGMDTLSADDYSALIRESGGYLAQAHPFRSAWYVEYKYPVNPALLDGIEIFNSTEAEENNAKAYAFAKKYNLAMQSGSDSHCKTGHFFSGIMLNKKAETIFDIIEAIKANESTPILPKTQSI